MPDLTAFVQTSTLTAVIGIAVGVSLPAIAMGWSISRAMDALARQPEAERSIMRTLFIGLAMIESLAIYVLVAQLVNGIDTHASNQHK